MDWLTVLIVLAAVAAVAASAWWVGKAMAQSHVQPTIRELDGKARSAESVVGELRLQLASLQRDGKELARQLLESEAKRAEATAHVSELERSSAGQLKVLEEARSKLSDAFASLAAEALKSNNEGFLIYARPAG